MELSIVASSFGRLDYCKNLVNSINNYLLGYNFEIIFVCSDAKESEKINWLRAQPNVKVICLSDRGFGKKRSKSLYYYENVGIIAATGTWIFVTNDDTELTKDFVEEWESIKEDFDVILVKGEIGDVASGSRIPVLGQLSNTNLVDRNFYLYDFALIRSDLNKKLGFLDERLDWYGKGLDLSIRVNQLTDVRVGHFQYGEVKHFISEELRNPPKPTKDFKYLNKKWNQFFMENPNVPIGIDVRFALMKSVYRKINRRCQKVLVIFKR
jgi:GT2 family glycosyltransferase